MVRIPESPPTLDILLGSLRKDPDRMIAVLARGNALAEGEYLHWDELRFRKPPEGLSREEWWASMKFKRAAVARELPFSDISGIPFVFQIPDRVEEGLHRIDMKLAGHIGVDDPEAGPALRDRRYLISSLIEEAIHSSQLEGASTTRQAAKEMLRTERSPRSRDERMIHNNYQAIHFVREHCRDDLSVPLLLELHEILTEGTMDPAASAGRFRREEDAAVHVADNRDGKVLYVPPPPESLEARIAAMVDFANRARHEPFIHPVIKSSILHFWLAYEHPFVDGNGRCARALFYWSMLRSGYWLCEYISISRIVHRAFAKYARAFLYAETDGNDLTYFLLYHLRVIEQAIEGLEVYVAGKGRESRRLEDRLPGMRTLNPRQRALVGHALRHPGASYTIRSHRNSHDIVYETARSDLMGLFKRGVLESTRQGRTMIFRPARDLEKRLAGRPAKRKWSRGKGGSKQRKGKKP